ncbi:MAG: ATPase [Bacteroidota bacterium]|nr:ATPase [Bacteroidota bacterium]
MKTLKVLLAVLLLTAFGSAATVTAQVSSQTSTKKTETFKVWGNCSMCKDRIEKAVKEEGATEASWNQKTKMLTVTFDPSKTNKDVLSKKLASVGHDTEKYKAPDDVYEKLPSCCHYERSK